MSERLIEDLKAARLFIGIDKNLHVCGLLPNDATIRSLVTGEPASMPLVILGEEAGESLRGRPCAECDDEETVLESAPEVKP